MTHIEVLKQCREVLPELTLGIFAPHRMTMAIAAIDSLPTEIGKTSDGYHTFDELYEHRFELYMALCRKRYDIFTWRSKVHSDGSSYDGWFLLGMKVTPGVQITYHLPMRLWGRCDFVSQTFFTADEVPPFDGHTSADVLERLKNL